MGSNVFLSFLHVNQSVVNRIAQCIVIIKCEQKIVKRKEPKKLKFREYQI